MKRLLIWLLKLYGYDIQREISRKHVEVYSEIILEMYGEINLARSAKGALSEIENTLFEIFMTQTNLNIIVSVEGDIVLANKAWLNTFGYKPDEIVGKPFFSFMHQEDIKPTLEYFENTKLEGFVSHKLINRYIAKDGSVVKLEWMPSKTGAEYSWGSAEIIDR